jgi:hypothetical protein
MGNTIRNEQRFGSPSYRDQFRLPRNRNGQIADVPIARLIAQIPMSGSTKVLESSPVFHLHVSELSARAVRTDEGIVVFEGSEAVADASKSLTGGAVGAATIPD